MKNEVTKKETNAVATTGEELSAWGPAQHISSQDVVIPRIMLMQALSKMVKNRVAFAGELRDSDGNLMAKEGEAIEIVPFYAQLMWYEYDISGTKEKLVNKTPINMENDDAPQLYQANGIAMKRYRTYEVYCFQAGKVEGLPLVMTFKSTSALAGRKIYSQMYATNLELNMAPPAFHMLVWAESKENDKGSFYVMDAKRGDNSTGEEMNFCLKWYNRIKKENIKVADLDDEQTDAPSRQNVTDDDVLNAKRASSAHKMAKDSDYQDVNFGQF